MIDFLPRFVDRKYADSRRFLPVAVFQKRRAPAARVVAAAGTLDLDHFGAEIGEELADPRTGEDAAHVEHTQMRERAAR